ncbi:MAG: DUF4870 domain-containing protein [Gemmatimonadota bacterium]|nr:DUF4870 domain-containing protein [Gemmatimonadota bacterium]
MEQQPPSQPPPPSAQSSGLDPQLAGLLAYLVPPITGIIFLLIEKANRVVRWHAAQSTVFGIAWIVLWVVFTILSTILSTVVPVFGAIGSLLIWLVIFLGGFVIWVICLIKGYSGEMWRMPIVAPYADKLMASDLGGGSTA